MRNIILLISLLASLQVSAQVLYDAETFSFKIIDSSIALKKTQIFAKSKQWVSSTFNKSSAVIDFEDNTSDVFMISLKPINNSFYYKLFPSGVYLRTNYVINISIKDGRYKIEATSFFCEGGRNSANVLLGAEGDLSVKKSKGYWSGGGHLSQKNYDKLKLHLKKEVSEILLSYQRFMKVEAVDDGF